MPAPDPSIVRIDGPWRHLDVHANGIRFHVVEANADNPSGAVTGRPLVMLLHGFGSFWWSWRHQLRALTGARVVAVDLRGYGGSDKPPRGYDGWTLAGDTAGLIRALGHSSATLIGHADGGLACWGTALLHSRLVRGIALISSPHPEALRRSTLTRRDQSRALLPTLLRYQTPLLPERLLTRHDGAEIERLVRARSGAKWLASQDYSHTIRYLRQAIQIPGAAHCALEYQRWAVRSQLRGEGHRFIKSTTAQLSMPLLHIRGDADPYVLAAPVERTQRYAPHGRYVSVSGAGHFSHEESPDEITRHLMRFLQKVHHLS
ncbi:alpha/beta hydrolase [Mycobacterium gordonae]|uniref:Alpha/beta hydrolase n=1 Tax=Mycobacterium gordonae TaxID=1778 RepID=A0A1A6BM62_MYCGO|nr:alpha/beta hydrolase [Mycobacterium gordonae]MBI2700481.1 alpha/beta hydrolase [Mycobacterium sp.]MCQ4364071.1 alpha/beta hydrolase [Mycobacterium gordonae]OBS03294.1 alpha/beta hydrolase [Mycobacterium gordonae]